MPQSLSLVIVHLTFSVKDRQPLLDARVRPALYAYLATVARREGFACFRAGGTTDHVHLALRLARTITIAKLAERVKTASSRWLKTQSPRLTSFSWQRGYGCFSVGPSDLEALCRYIDGQEQHHRKRSFQDEFRTFLARYSVEYNEAYVWD